MIEEDLMYCPNCREEYRADITTCADCGTDLVSGRDVLAAKGSVDARRQARMGDLRPEDDVVVVHQGQLNEIRPLEKVLQHENIGALVAGDDSGCGKGCCGTTLNLLVRREEAPEAYQLIQAELDRTRGLASHDMGSCEVVFDQNAQESECPACGFRFASTISTCPDCGLCFG